VVERVLREFLKCGLLEHGFARLWCSECRRSVLVAFSCRGRSFCPSCEKKKQLLWAEWLREELLAPVPHRHVVLTIPRLLRPLLRRRRDLLIELARAGAEATVELVRRGAERDLRPGLVVSVATAGDLLQWHPHLHLLTTDGGVAPDGRFLPLPEWDATLLMGLFRERILARLLDRHAISTELVDPLEWLARMSDHIPDPGQHRTVFYGQYANRARGAGRRDTAQMPEASTEPPRRRCSPTWARLIAKIYQVDPLVCTRCGRKMQMIAFLTDQLSIRKILDHLGLGTPPQDKPPPAREILRVASTARAGACRPSGRDLTACRAEPSTHEVTLRGTTLSSARYQVAPASGAQGLSASPPPSHPTESLPSAAMAPPPQAARKETPIGSRTAPTTPCTSPPNG
jgi:hypothetical protein